MLNYIMVNKTLKILYILLFSFTPLIMLRDTSELFEFNKMIFIYLIAILVLFIWGLKMILNKKIILNKTPFFWVIILFILSQVVSTIFSIDFHTSLFGYYGRFNGGLISIITYLFLFAAFVSNFDKKFLYTLLKASLISSFLVILWGLPGMLGHDLSCLVFTGSFDNGCWTDQFKPAERMFSTFGQPNWLGAYLSINFFIGLYFFVVSPLCQEKCTRGVNLRLHKGTIVYFIYLLFNFSAILFTRSRSSLLAVVICFFLFLLYFFFVNIRDKSRLVPTGKIIFVLIFSLFLSTAIFKTGIDQIDKYFSLTTYIQQFNGSNHQTANKTNVRVADLRPLQITNKITPSSEIRKIVWLASMDLVNKYPLFGTGVETFAYSYYFVRPISHNLTSEWDYLYNKAHNEYLNYLATTGLFGLSTYALLILIVGFIFIRQIFNKNSSRLRGRQTSLRSNNKTSYPLSESGVTSDESRSNLLLVSLLLSYVTILITNFFGFSITIINLFFFLIPAFLIVLSTSPENNDPSPFAGSLSYKQVISLILNSFICLYLFISVILYFIADLNYSSGNNSYKAGNYATAYRSIDLALKLHYEHVYEDKLSFILASLAASQNNTENTKKEMYLSEYYNLKSLKASPLNVLYWKTRFKNDYLFYQITLDNRYLNNGLEALAQAAALSPTDPKIPYSKALFYSILYDHEKDNAKKQNYETLSLKEIDDSIKLKNDFLDGYFLKGQLLKRYKHEAEAKKIFQFILDNLDPNNQEVKKELESL